MSAFTPGFRAQLADPIDEAALMRCLDTLSMAPPVGQRALWRLMHLASSATRTATPKHFEVANVDALAINIGLKLPGMHDAPVHLAICRNASTEKRPGLGSAPRPETRR